MKLYILTEEALNIAVERAIEICQLDNNNRFHGGEDINLCPIIREAIIEQAEKSGHIIERNYFGELSKVNILQTLKNCFPKERTPPPLVEKECSGKMQDDSDFLFRKGS
jgi:hypothetical protein